jgi:hypothetical protein
MFDQVDNYKITGPFRVNEQEPVACRTSILLDASRLYSATTLISPVESGSSSIHHTEQNDA